MNQEDTFTEANRSYQRGDLRECLEMYREILGYDPDNARALHAVGVVGFILAEQTHAAADVERALESVNRALAVDPGYVVAWNSRGKILLSQGNHSEAKESFLEALKISPNDLSTLELLAKLNRDSGNPAEAAKYFEQALRLKPKSSLWRNELGNLRAIEGKREEAISSYRLALEYDPTYALAWYNLGLELTAMGDFSGAQDSYEQAIHHAPGFPEASANLAALLTESGRIDDAVGLCRRALAEKPDCLEALINLGNALLYRGDIVEAITAFRTVLDNSPGYVQAHSNLLFALYYSSAYSNEDIFAESRHWEQLHAHSRQELITRGADESTWPRRLKIGYVSPDFKKHPVASFIESVLSRHDHVRFEIYCFSDVVIGDEVTARLKSYADQWFDCAEWRDEQLRDVIEFQAIDILVDLAGHTARNRLAMFTYRPALVQVTWLGYPGTTGLSCVDYRISDAVADPPGDSDAQHSETLYRLPRTFLCFTPPRQLMGRRTPPSVRSGVITFGSFNNFKKMNNDVLGLWARILLSAPGSRLMIKNKSLGSVEVAQRVMNYFTNEGITPDRIILVAATPSCREHLKLYNSVDIALDTFPYNGTTTTCEALWMGVPVVTLVGGRHAARVGASLLTALNLTELQSTTPDEYLRVALDLANNPDKLRWYRKNLRTVVKKSPLGDAEQFTRDLEAAFLKMWSQYLEQV